MTKSKPVFVPVTLITKKRSISKAVELAEAYGIWDGIGLTIYTKHLFISEN